MRTGRNYFRADRHCSRILLLRQYLQAAGTLSYGDALAHDFPKQLLAVGTLPRQSIYVVSLKILGVLQIQLHHCPCEADREVGIFPLDRLHPADVLFT